MSRANTIPALVINLDRSRDRLALMQDQLETLQIPNHRLSATDGQQLSPFQVSALYDEKLNLRQYHKRLTRGEIGCYHSHLRACQWLLDSQHKHLLVLEDDVILSPSIRKALELISNIHPGWDLIKLGSVSAKPIAQTTVLGQFHLNRYRKNPISAFAQVLSRQGAEKLLRTRTPFARPYDVDLQYPWENDLRVLGLEPYPVRIRPNVKSEISPHDERVRVNSRLFGLVEQRLAYLYLNCKYNAQARRQPSHCLEGGVRGSD